MIFESLEGRWDAFDPSFLVNSMCSRKIMVRGFLKPMKPAGNPRYPGHWGDSNTRPSVQRPFAGHWMSRNGWGATVEIPNGRRKERCHGATASLSLVKIACKTA
ncbi:MAG: hypothetical protein ACTSUE_08445 [Promethearchaeota archaeon]